MAENRDTYQHKSNCEGCDEFINTDCIVYEGELPYLGLEKGASSTEIIIKLTQTVEYLQQQINALKSGTV